MLEPLILLLVLIFLNALFSCAEIAVIEISAQKLKKMSADEDKRAARLLRLTAHPAHFFAAIHAAITFAGFLQSAFAAQTFSEPLISYLKSLGTPLPEAVMRNTSIVIITLLVVCLNIVFGELIPKKIAAKKAESLSLAMSGMLCFVSKLFAPLIWLLTFPANIILRIFGITPDESDEQVTEDEIRMMLEEGNEQGTIMEEENEIIQNVFEFNDITVGDIATHRVDVDILWTDDEEQDWEETIHQTRHTLYPVCEKSADNIIGILNAKDYFRLEDKSRESVLENAVHPAYFVPETITADVLFRNMKATRNTLAVIIDEYGGMEGIITMFDLIEELVGELGEENEESDKPEPAIEKTGENRWLIRGNVTVEDLEEATGLELADDNYDTFTGLVFDVLGIIPDDGEQKISVTLPKMEVLITRVGAHQIERAEITLIPEPDENLNE